MWNKKSIDHHVVHTDTSTREKRSQHLDKVPEEAVCGGTGLTGGDQYQDSRLFRTGLHPCLEGDMNSFEARLGLVGKL